MQSRSMTLLCLANDAGVTIDEAEASIFLELL